MIPLTFRRLEVFLAVVDAGSFVGAADKLNISHPSVSNHIRALEDMMRCELFQRRRGTVSSLTEQGRRLYERGQELLQQARRLQDDMLMDTPRQSRRPLLISCQRSVAMSWLCRPMAVYAQENPNVEFRVEVGGYETAVSDVLLQRADLGFLMSYEKILDFAAEKIGRATFSFYCAPDHALAQMGTVSVKELKSYPLISTKRESRFGLMEINMMADAGITDFAPMHQIQEGTIVQELAMLGLGVFCGLDRIAARHVAAGALVKVPVEAPPMAMDVHFAFASNKRQSKVAKQFIDFLRDYPHEAD
jgi:Transcriptional regulator